MLSRALESTQTYQIELYRALERTQTYQIDLSRALERTQTYQIELSYALERTKLYKTLLSTTLESTKWYKTILSTAVESQIIPNRTLNYCGERKIIITTPLCPFIESSHLSEFKQLLKIFKCPNFFPQLYSLNYLPINLLQHTMHRLITR